MHVCATVASRDFVSSFGHIWCMAVEGDGTCLVCTRSALYAIPPDDGGGWRDAMPELIAGQHNATRIGLKDGQGSQAKFNYPRGICVDRQGNILLADSCNNAVRKVTRCGAVTTLAGALGIAGYADGRGSAALFSNPTGVAVCSDGTILVADTDNHCLRTVSSIDGTTETVAGGLVGYDDGEGKSARFCYPGACALDSGGNLIVADVGNDCIRRVYVPLSSAACPWLVTTVAGSAGSRGFADGERTDALFSCPTAVAVDSSDNVLVADRKNHRIRMVDNISGRVRTLCGSAEPGRNDGTGNLAHFNQPHTLALDRIGQLLVAEFKCLGRVRVARIHLPWTMLRILFVGLLKCRATAGGTGCCFALLPVESGKGLTSPMLSHIIQHIYPVCLGLRS